MVNQFIAIQNWKFNPERLANGLAVNRNGHTGYPLYMQQPKEVAYFYHFAIYLDRFFVYEYFHFLRFLLDAPPMPLTPNKGSRNLLAMPLNIQTYTFRALLAA